MSAVSTSLLIPGTAGCLSISVYADGTCRVSIEGKASVPSYQILSRGTFERVHRLATTVLSVVGSGEYKLESSGHETYIVEVVGQGKGRLYKLSNNVGTPIPGELQELVQAMSGLTKW